MESKYCILKRHHESSFDMVTKVGGNNETTLSRHRARLSWLQNYKKKISLSKNTFRQPIQILDFKIPVVYYFLFSFFFIYFTTSYYTKHNGITSIPPVIPERPNSIGKY